MRDGGAIAGIVTVDSIVRGRFQSATLSYAAFAPTAGRGYMSEGLARWAITREMTDFPPITPHPTQPAH